MKSKQDLKSFFENGDKPNQEQFWALIESYFHKDEPITLEELSMLKANLATIDKTSNGTETIGNVDTKEQVNAKINTAINALKANAPETYDTLKEIADYIANDSNAEAALLQLINTKLDKPTMTNNYYGLWDDTNKKFVNGSIYKNGSNTYISDKLYTPSGINTKDLSFTLQTNIIPTPNTLVPKTDGTRPTWYNNSSVVKEIAFLDDISGGGGTLKYFAESSNPPTAAPSVAGSTGIAIGNGAQSLSDSAFALGDSAGIEAYSVWGANFIGYSSGYQATGCSYSNFIGDRAGFKAVNSSNSNFIGSQAGASDSVNYNGASSSYSNLFGYRVGVSWYENHIGDNNIIIGKNITLGNGISDSMNIGGVLFGTGFQSDIGGNPKIEPVTNGKIGIGVTNPSEKLEVAGNIKVLENGSGIILTSPDGTKTAKISIDNSGNLVTTLI